MARKKAKKLENPFVYQGYEGPEYFFDRTEETENILSSLRNGRNITLISPRKIGKTDRRDRKYPLFFKKWS